MREAPVARSEPHPDPPEDRRRAQKDLTTSDPRTACLPRWDGPGDAYARATGESAPFADKAGRMKTRGIVRALRRRSPHFSSFRLLGKPSFVRGCDCSLERAFRC